MTDETDVLRKALTCMEDAVRMKNMNQELMQHLTGSVFYLIRYSEKHDLPLPNKEALFQMLEKANFLIDQIVPPTDPNNHTRTPRFRTEPDSGSVQMTWCSGQGVQKWFSRSAAAKGRVRLLRHYKDSRR